MNPKAMVSYEYFCRIHNPIMRVALSSAQWTLFFLTGGLVAPIVVAAAFHPIRRGDCAAHPKNVPDYGSIIVASSLVRTSVAHP